MAFSALVNIATPSMTSHVSDSSPLRICLPLLLVSLLSGISTFEGQAEWAQDCRRLPIDCVLSQNPRSIPILITLAMFLHHVRTVCKCSKSQVGREGCPGTGRYRPQLALPCPTEQSPMRTGPEQGSTRVQSRQLSTGVLFGGHPLSPVGILLDQSADPPIRFGSLECRHPQTLVYLLPHGMTIPAPPHCRPG